MAELKVLTSEDRLQRFMDLASEKQQEQEEIEDSKKNRDFAQVYREGFDRIKSLILKNPSAARLYVFLAEQIEPGTGAVVASQELLGEELGVTTRTIRRLVQVLEDDGAIVKIKLGAGSISAYCLNPDEVWKSWNTQKQYAAFNTKTLARKGDNGDVRRKLKVMLKTQEPDEEQNSNL